MKNRYQELSEKHQKEFNKLPLGFAYSDKQFKEVMTRWGLDPKKDLDKLVRIPGGGFIQKKTCSCLKMLLEKIIKKCRQQSTMILMEQVSSMRCSITNYLITNLIIQEN